MVAVWTDVAVVAILVGAAFFQSVVGFGSAVVAAPLLLTIVSRQDTVSALTVVGLVLSAFLSYRIDAIFHQRLIGRLVAGAVVGMPLGLALLIAVPVGPFKVGVGVVAVLLAVASLRVRIPAGHGPMTLAAGVVSGVMQTSTTMSGPPVVLLLASSPMPRSEIRRTLQAYFGLLGLISLPLFLATGVFTWRGGLLGLAASPLVVVAGVMGNRTAARVRQEQFRLLALGVVALSGAAAVISGIRG